MQRLRHHPSEADEIGSDLVRIEVPDQNPFAVADAMSDPHVLRRVAIKRCVPLDVLTGLPSAHESSVGQRDDLTEKPEHA